MVGLAIRGHCFFKTVLFFPHQSSGFHFQRSIAVRVRPKEYPVSC
jgi:hypothetical protein